MLDDPLQQIELRIVRRDSQSTLSHIARASKTTTRDHRPRKSSVTVGISRITRNKFLAKHQHFREALLRKKKFQLGEVCGLNRSCRLHFLNPNTEPKDLGSRKRTYIRVIGDRHLAHPRQKDSTTLHGFSRSVRGSYACPRLPLASRARARGFPSVARNFEVLKFKRRTHCATHQRPRTKRFRSLPCMRGNFQLRSLPLKNCRAKNLPRLRLAFTRNRKLQRRTRVEVPNFCRIHAMPTVHDPTRQQKINRRARAAHRRVSLLPPRLTIKPTFWMRAKIKHTNEILSGCS